VDVGRANRNSLWLHPAHLSAVLDCRRLFQSLSHFPLLFLPVSGRFFHSVTLSLAPLIWRLRPSFKVPLCRRPISDVAFHFLLHVLVYRIKSTNGYNYQFLLVFYGILKKILYLRLLFVVFAIQFHVERLRSRSNGYRIELSICYSSSSCCNGDRIEPNRALYTADPIAVVTRLSPPLVECFDCKKPLLSLSLSLAVSFSLTLTTSKKRQKPKQETVEIFSRGNKEMLENKRNSWYTVSFRSFIVYIGCVEFVFCFSRVIGRGDCLSRPPRE
jgi:hypothetical protein